VLVDANRQRVAWGEVDLNDDIKIQEQKILDNLRGKFIESARQKLTVIGAVLDVFRASPSTEGLESVIMEIHTLKGLAGTFGYRDFSLIAARLEVYLKGLSKPTQKHIDDVELYIASLGACIERDVHLDGAELEQILTTLPTR